MNVKFCNYLVNPQNSDNKIISSSVVGTRIIIARGLRLYNHGMRW